MGDSGTSSEVFKGDEEEDGRSERVRSRVGPDGDEDDVDEVDEDGRYD